MLNQFDSSAKLIRQADVASESQKWLVTTARTQLKKKYSKEKLQKELASPGQRAFFTRVFPHILFVIVRPLLRETVLTASANNLFSHDVPVRNLARTGRSVKSLSRFPSSYTRLRRALFSSVSEKNKRSVRRRSLRVKSKTVFLGGSGRVHGRGWEEPRAKRQTQP